ncbi:hypothetical protein P9112_006926 [Eukaryota sp. TZLM1-RC]
MQKYVSYPSRVIHSSDFELAVIKVSDNDEQFLILVERNSLTAFQTDDKLELFLSPSLICAGVKRTVQDRMKLRQQARSMDQNRSFIDLPFIACTTVEVERLFSRAKSMIG